MNSKDHAPADTQFDKLMGLFQEALEKHSPSEWEGFVQQAAGDDDELHRQVCQLLHAHAHRESFFDRPAMVDPTIDQSVVEQPGAQIGPYKLLQQIGEGGMGVVYMAEQKTPVKRRVALKIIKPGMDTRQVIARFEAERQALAMMDHPNIARVLDAGATGSGRPYFVMELVNGLPVTTYCDEQRLTTRERLELFAPICHAVQHAHQKGIIHRDLKPSNILIALYDGRPVPKIIDFGVAKATSQTLTEKTMFTQLGQVVGTLEYMSPEQAERNQLDIDTRSDVYSLGVVLYELLTGDTPFDRQRLRSAALDEILRIIREEEPSKPSAKVSSSHSLPSVAVCRRIEAARLSALMRGDLDWIVMKALEKDRGRRYETANAFAADVLRHLTGEAVQAHPPSKAYRLKKFVRRNKGKVMAASLVLLALLAGMAGTTWGLFEARQQEHEARRQEQIARGEATEKERARAAEAERVKERDAALIREAERADELKHRLGVSQFVLANAAYENNRDVILAAEWLEKVPPEQRGWEWRYLKQQTTGGIFTLHGHTGPVTSVAYNSDGTRIVTGAWRGPTTKRLSAMVWDARTGAFYFELKGPWDKSGAGDDYGIASPPPKVSFSPDDSMIVTGGGGSTATVWNARTGEILLELSEPSSTSVAFSPDGTRIATGGADGRVTVWDAKTGAALVNLDHGSGVMAYDAVANDVSFSPDGKRIATAGGRSSVWDAQTGELLFDLQAANRMPGYSIAFSPDGARIVLGRGDGIAMVMSAEDGKPWRNFHEIKHAEQQDLVLIAIGESGIHDVSFSPDGTRLATAGAIGNASEVWVWDARTGRELPRLFGHTSWVRSVAFSPDGMRIASGANDGTVKVWDAHAEAPSVLLRGHIAAVNSVSFSPDSQRIATANNGTMHWINEMSDPNGKTKPLSVWVWDAEKGTHSLELIGQKGVVQAVAFSPDGTKIVTAGWQLQPADMIGRSNPTQQGHATVWNAKTGAAMFALTGFQEGVQSVAFSSDSKRIVTGGAQGGQRMMMNGQRGTLGGTEVKVWDAGTGDLQLDLTEPSTAQGTSFSDRGVTVAFSPDGRQIAIAGVHDKAGGDGASSISRTKVCDAATGDFLYELKGAAGLVQNLAYSPDGKRIATCTDKRAKLWEVQSGRAVELFEMSGHTGNVMSVAFSPDGARIVTGSADRTVRVWDAQTGTWLLTLPGDIGAVLSVAFSPDGTRIAAGGAEEPGQPAQAKVWSVPPLEHVPMRLTGHAAPLTGASFSPDGARIVTGSADRTARVWDAQTGTILVEFKGHTGPVQDVRFSPDGKLVVTRDETYSTDGMASAVKIWDVESGTEQLELQGNRWATSATFSASSKQIVLDHQDRSVTVWDPQTGRELADELDGSERVPNVLISPDGEAFIQLDGNDAQILPMNPGRELRDYRRLRTETSVEQNREGFLAARSTEDPFAADFYFHRIPPAERKTLEVQADMRALAPKSELAEQHMTEGEWEQALPLLIEVMNGKREKLGKDDPETLQAMTQVGDAHFHLGQMDEGAALFEAVLNVQEAKLGRRHEDTLDTMAKLAAHYQGAKRIEQAIPLLEEAYPTIPYAGSILLEAYVQAGENAKLSRFIEQYLIESRKTLPPDSGDLAIQLQQFGNMLMTVHDFPAAEKLFRESLAIGQQRPDAMGLEWLSDVQSHLGQALLGQGRFAEAEPFLLESYESQKKIWANLGSSVNTELAEVVNRMIGLYEALARPDEVTKWRAELAKYPVSTAPITGQP